MHSYFAHLSPQHRRSWLLVVAYVAALLAISLADFGANTAGQTMFRGMLLGMLIFLVASGLSLIFGVMRLVNIAHGDLIVLAAYVALVVVQLTGLHPLASAIVVLVLLDSRRVLVSAACVSSVMTSFFLSRSRTLLTSRLEMMALSPISLALSTGIITFMPLLMIVTM